MPLPPLWALVASSRVTFAFTFYLYQDVVEN